MTIILRMQQLPWSATSMDIRRYFSGLSIPDGGVHIVGGENGDVFIAFSSDEDARRAMQTQNRPLCGNKIALMLSSKSEMQEVIARNRAVSQTKSDPFQEDSPGQSPGPAVQPLITPGGDSLNQSGEYAGFKDPGNQPPSANFNSKGQKQPLLPSEDARVPGLPPRRPGGDKSLLGIPPYSSQQRSNPALGRQPPGFSSDPLIGGRHDERYPDFRREGEPENRSSSSPGSHNVGPFGAEKDRHFGEQSGGRSFRGHGEFPKHTPGLIPSDMDSRTPSGRRPPLLEHELGRPDGRPPFGSHSDRREVLLDDPDSKRLKRGPDRDQAPPFGKGPFQPEKEKFGKPNVPGRFDEGKHWDRSFPEPQPGYPKDHKDSEFPRNNGPGTAKGGTDRRPLRRSRFEPEGQWDQKRPGMVETGRLKGDPFGLNEGFDEPRIPTSAPRDHSSERGGLDSGRRGPLLEHVGPEDYRKGDEPFGTMNRSRKQHVDDRMVPGDQRGPERMGRGARSGPGEQRGTRDERRGREDHMGIDEPTGPGEHRHPGDRMGLDGLGRPGEGRGPSNFGLEESRVLGQQRGVDGPIDRMSPGNRMGPGDGIGPRDRMRREDEMGPGVRRGPDGHGGRGDRIGLRDHVDPGNRRGPVEHIFPGDRMGPGDHMGYEDRRGPRDRRRSDDHSEPIGARDRFGPGEPFGPGKQFGPGDRMSLDDPMGEPTGPRDRMGSVDRRGPGGRVEDQFVPSNRIGMEPMDDDFGPGKRMGPDGQKGIGSRFGPEGRFGPPSNRGLQDDVGQSEPWSSRDPLDRRDVSDRFDPRGRLGHPGDQWEQRDRGRPVLLGDKGLLEVEDRPSQRGPTEFGADDGIRSDNRIGPAEMARKDALIPERSRRDQHGPDNRRMPGDYLGSREVPSFHQESHLGSGSPGRHEGLVRDSDMRRSSGGRHLLEAPPAHDHVSSRHSDSRKKSSTPGFLRVTGMPFVVTAADIITFFDGLRIAENGIRLSLDTSRNKPNGNGYIKFVSEEDATKACKLSMKYMGKRYLELKLCRKEDWDSSHRFSVPPVDSPPDDSKPSHRSRSRSPIRSNCVELRGLPHHADSQHIKDFFFGLDVASDKVYIAQSGDGSATGIAYVEFRDNAAFEKALRKNDSYIGRNMIEVKPIFKEVMSVHIAENKKRIQDRQASSRSSSNSKDVSSRERSTGSRGSSSKDTKTSASKDRNSRDSSSRSSRDRDSRQSSKYGRDSRRSSDQESRSSDSRQPVSKSRDQPKDASSRSSDSHSRHAGDSSSQKRESESKDQDNRRSGPGSKQSPKDTESKRPESTSKDVTPRSQQEPQPSKPGKPPRDIPPRGLIGEAPAAVPKQVAQHARSAEEGRSPGLDEKSCISMRNMPYNTSDEEIHNFFQEMSIEPLMVHFLITPDGRPNGQAYVEMASVADAHKAASKTSARIQDRNIIMSLITKGFMKNCLAQGKPPQPGPALLGMPRGPPFPHAPGMRPPMELRPPLLGSSAPPFGMRNNPGPLRGPRLPPVEVLIARGCVVETSNLPFDIPIPAIIDFFGNHNVVPESVRLKTNEHGRFSGEARVAFRTSEDANQAIADLNKSILGGRVIRLHLMQPM